MFLLITACASAQFKYPAAKKGSQVDDYFGTKVSDPYRWMENDTAADTKTWIKEEHQFTENYLSKIPFRSAIRKRVKELINYPTYYGAFKVGDYILFEKNTGLQNQYVYYIQKGINGTPKVFIDPNKLSADGTVSLVLDAASYDKKYISYHINKNGSDWSTTYVMDIAANKPLKDSIRWMRGDGEAWVKGGFYYVRYPELEKGKELTAVAVDPKVYYHKLGDSQADDKFIYEYTNDTCISHKYTSKGKLAIQGGSNGGLLIGAVMTQRPDLCKVAFPEVGVMDMLRFQKFTSGVFWTSEYGSSDNAVDFPFLYKYSPLHNIRENKYPATMVMTADHDDRVVPMHSFKFAATLQEKQKGDEPVLIRIETNQGHGASGYSLTKAIGSITDMYSFLFYNMGITPVFH